MIDWGKVKTVEVEKTIEVTDETGTEVEIEVVCEVECIQECPEESSILSVIDADGNDRLDDLSDLERNSIIDAAHYSVDWTHEY